MSILSEKSNLAEYFTNDTFVSQKVFKSKKKYIPLYINADLYEQLFNEEYDEQRAFENISSIFSITLDQKNSTNEMVGYGYADRQEDPMGISLSGNQGSGRAYFYGKYFNIKGDKTSLATSPNEAYSNGKLSLAAAIKETIISNILSKELTTPTFETLAILDTTNKFDFICEYLATDDSVKEERYTLPSVIEVRVNKDKRLYRISNAFANKNQFSFEQLKTLCKKLALLESEKFIKRFLHGSWSVGNISVNSNLIDFDTSSFVQGRNPQYSNTNKYKSNYFGYEFLGSKIILKLLFENTNGHENNNFRDLEDLFDLKYNEYLKKEFYQIIGLNDTYYEKYNNLIDELFIKFMNLSRKFLPNFYALNVLEDNNNNTFVFNFSKFFQHYLIGKKNYNGDLLFGVNLLLNNTITITYIKVGFIKEKVEEFFKEDITFEKNNSQILIEAINFINLYNELFDKIESEHDLKRIKLKQYILNMNRSYLYSNEDTFSILSHLYIDGKIDNFSLNKIIKYLISTNIRIFNDNINEYLCDLKLYEEFLSYKVVAHDYYYFVLVPYNNSYIRFAKLIIDEKEYMLSLHTKDSNLYSEKIPYNEINELENIQVSILVNGRVHKEMQILRK